MVAGVTGDALPATWEPYHPAHDDYQVPGDLPALDRSLLECGDQVPAPGGSGRASSVPERPARPESPLVMVFTEPRLPLHAPGHRNGPGDAEQGGEATSPDVAVHVLRGPHRHAQALQLPAEPACELEVTLSATGPSTDVLEIRSQAPTSGRSRGWPCAPVAGTYHHDNLDIDEPFHRWRYVFDEATFPIGALDAIGLAANNAYGVTTVVNVDPATGAASRRVLNDPSARRRGQPRGPDHGRGARGHARGGRRAA